MKDIIGKKFGRWTILKLEYTGPRYNKYYIAICKCGNIRLKLGSVITTGQSLSCGCSRRKHGEAGLTVEWRAWSSMKRRCYNKNCQEYKNYGGRGISVCREWKTSYPNFLQDIGRRPGLNYSLDRIENNKNYTSRNCRWATRKEQASNRRSRVDRKHYSCE